MSKFNRDNRKHRGGRRGRHQDAKGGAAPADLDNPIVCQFNQFAIDLDRRHDKRERLVKLSRDITIESKRIIFLLHRFDLSQVEVDDESGKHEVGVANEAILKEAETRLEAMKKTMWKDVAEELGNEDPYFFLRAYTGGLQEYVEAVSFYYHLKHGRLVSWDQVRKDLKFLGGPPTELADENKNEAKTDIVVTPANDEVKPDSEVMVPGSDFMLGIADLTGEVMRQAINSAGCGNTELCFVLLKFLQEIHDGFVGMKRDSHREVPKKLAVLRQSLRKVETVCYNINVRGTEVPKHLLGTYLELSGSNQASHGDFEMHDEQYDRID